MNNIFYKVLIMLNLYGVHTYFMNNQDPQAPRKTKKNCVKNLKRAQATSFSFGHLMNKFQGSCSISKIHLQPPGDCFKKQYNCKYYYSGNENADRIEKIRPQIQ